jgi:hypothetical protein
MRQLPPLILPALVFGATAGYVAEIAKRRHFSLFIDELQNVVRVPVPERYAIHKLIVSQIRGTATSKVAKDLQQAATLIKAVVDRFPGAIEEALSTVPKSAHRYLRRAIPALKRHLTASAEAGWDVLQSRV